MQFNTTEYRFAKYNIQPINYTYSQDEYARFLEGQNREHLKDNILA